MDNIKISLAIVCRNALPELRATLDSIMARDDSRILPIIIDGDSSDGTPRYLRELDGWAHHAVSEPDRGIYDAMNKAWKIAPVDSYILFLGAGDLLLQLPSNAKLIDGGGLPYPVVIGWCDVGDRPFRSRWSNEMRIRNTAHHQALMIRKSVSIEPPFDLSFPVYADWDFNLRLFRSGIKAMFVDELRSYAALGGVSWSMDISELTRVAGHHGGALTAALSWSINSASRWKRFHNESSS